jgi:hypothetical protein
MVNTNAPVLGTSTDQPTIRFDLPVGRFNVAYKRNRDDMDKIDIDYIPEISIGDATTINCTVINTQATIV